MFGVYRFQQNNKTKHLLIIKTIIMVMKKLYNMKKIPLHVTIDHDLYTASIARGINYSETLEKGIRVILANEDSASQSKIEVQQAKYTDAIKTIADSLRENKGALNENVLVKATFWEKTLLEKYGLNKSRYQLIDDAKKKTR